MLTISVPAICSRRTGTGRDRDGGRAIGPLRPLRRSFALPRRAGAGGSPRPAARSGGHRGGWNSTPCWRPSMSGPSGSPPAMTAIRWALSPEPGTWTGWPAPTSGRCGQPGNWSQRPAPPPRRSRVPGAQPPGARMAQVPVHRPGLPAALLPAHWPGTQAAELFDTESARLLPAAPRFVDCCLRPGEQSPPSGPS